MTSLDAQRVGLLLLWNLVISAEHNKLTKTTQKCLQCSRSQSLMVYTEESCWSWKHGGTLLSRLISLLYLWDFLSYHHVHAIHTYRVNWLYDIPWRVCVQGLCLNIAPCSIVLGPAAFLCRPAAGPETTCSMHGVLTWCNQSLGVALSAEDE